MVQDTTPEIEVDPGIQNTGEQPQQPQEQLPLRRSIRERRSAIPNDYVTNFLLESEDSDIDDADANVQTEIFMYPTSTKSRVQIENEAFNKLMYAGDIPKRLVGYGFGVKQSDIFGVRSILRKEKFQKDKNDSLALQNMEKKMANLTETNEGLLKQNQDILKIYNKNNDLLKNVLDVLSTGKTPTHVLNLAKTAFNATNAQASDSSNATVTPE
ncbi:hypothetical protein KSS87_000691 [Heliosperma pusillum]|nr:hypothetical protein KSS87_000691 [Heliosperma pusillum]